MDLSGQRLVVPEQYRLNKFALHIQTQFQVPFADHALALHDKIVVELRGREALAPNLSIQQARHLQTHLGRFQRAVGFDALREVAFIEQFAGDLLEGGGKIPKIGFGDAQASRRRVPAKFPDQRRMAFADQVQRVAQMQCGDGAPGAFQLPVVRAREGDRRAMEFILEARREDADHALVPGFVEQYQAGRFDRLRTGTMVRMAHPAIDLLQRRQRAVLHLRFDAASFAVQRVQPCCDLHRGLRIVGQQAVDAQAHVVQPARRIQARPDGEAQILAGGFLRFFPRNMQQRVDARAGAPGADALQAMLHEDAVVLVQLYHIGDRSQRDQIE